MRKFDINTAGGILFTDQYQLMMAQLYFRLGMHEKQAQFDHFFRSYPDYGAHKAGYCISAGLEWLVDWMQDSRFGEKEINYLREQKTADGKQLFGDDFLKWLSENGNFSAITLKAIPEGRVIHPNTPVTSVKGPLASAQILETALLNHLNFQILIATKASRIRDVVRSQMVLEFGARRAQDGGGIAGVRAALIGGADYSSNVGISHVLGFPPKGTHAHSMVQLFIALGMSEYEAFEAFAEQYHNDSIFLVDTINTLESGIPNAIKVFDKMKKKGGQPAGIRLDSGDLAYLSLRASRMLDDAGYSDVKIVLSNELDEMVIWQITTQIRDEAPKLGLDADKVIGRLVYGIGTRLITSSGNPALSGVYKLVAVEDEGNWKPALKLSETPEKMSDPGSKQVWRLYDKNGKATADMISLEEENAAGYDEFRLYHPWNRSKSRVIGSGEISHAEPLLETVMDSGKLIYNFPSIEEIRERRRKDVDSLDAGVKRLINPHYYHVSISERLMAVKDELVSKLRQK